jgi:hypothetical protein
MNVGFGEGGEEENAVLKAAVNFRSERLSVFQNRTLIRWVIYVKIQEFIPNG